MAQLTNSPPPGPCVVGVVTASMLESGRFPEALWRCDGAELRADGLDPEGIVPALRTFAARRAENRFQGMVVFTLRLRRDGGSWEDSRADARDALWPEAASAAVCDLVDWEIEEAERIPAGIRAQLSAAGVGVLLSHHAFESEPSSAWEAELDSMRALRPEAVKFAVRVENPAAAGDLLRFARSVGREFPRSAVLGMGEAGRTTRVLSPLLGCPITYGYLDGEPVAPGQLSAAALTAFFASGQRPDPQGSESDWLRWAEQRLETPSGTGSPK